MIVWIASYPKCGNTWVRSFLSAYYYSSNGNFEFELLKHVKQFPTREFFGRKLNSVEEAAENWLLPQKIIKDKKEKLFLKTHNVYGAYKGKNFTTPEYTLGAINIVRDPRNVLTSLMNHYSLDENGALNMIKSIYRNLRNENENDDFSNYSFISSWSNNYKSWKMARNINKILIKYEDLQEDTENTFAKIIKFTNKLLKNNEIVDLKKLKKSVQTTNFNLLKKKEESEGFIEGVYSKGERVKKKFFNLGKDNDYKKLLKSETIKEIEKSFYNEMKELDYLE